MTSHDWLKKAIRFDMGMCVHHCRPVHIETRGQIDGRTKWVVKMNEWCLGKDGEFHFEPMPSSRTDEFILMTRFNSYQEAYKTWKLLVKSEKELYID